MRGPGEKQLEVDRRLVEKRIHDLRSELARDRAPQGAARWPRARDRMTVSLVGYTNAGKSTLMNALTGADVLAAGRAVRHARHAHAPLAVARLGAGAVERHGRLHPRPAAPSDRQLQGHAGRGPAGRSAAARGRRQQSGRATSRSPRSTRCWRRSASRQKDTLLVVNKIDALPDRARLDGLLDRYPNAVPISARTGLGLAKLAGGGQRGPQPQLSRRRRGDRRRERPAAGLPGRPRRSPLEAVPRQPRGRPLPHAAAARRPIHEQGTVVRPHERNGYAVENGSADQPAHAIEDVA